MMQKDETMKQITCQDRISIGFLFNWVIYCGDAGQYGITAFIVITLLHNVSKNNDYRK